MNTPAAAKKTHTENVHETYVVIVWFAVDSAPRSLAGYASLAAAEREARAYLSDARGVWIEFPDGSRSVVR